MDVSARVDQPADLGSADFPGSFINIGNSLVTVSSGGLRYESVSFAAFVIVSSRSYLVNQHWQSFE